jgi:hypothetical protein
LKAEESQHHRADMRSVPFGGWLVLLIVLQVASTLR